MKIIQTVAISLAFLLVAAPSGLVAMEQVKLVEKSGKQELKSACGWTNALFSKKGIFAAVAVPVLGWLSWSKSNRDTAFDFLNKNRKTIGYTGVAALAGYSAYRWLGGYMTPLKNLLGGRQAPVLVKEPAAEGKVQGNEPQGQGKTLFVQAAQPESIRKLDALFLELTKGMKQEDVIAQFVPLLKLAVQNTPYELLENEEFVARLSAQQKVQVIDICKTFREECLLNALHEMFVGQPDVKDFFISNLQHFHADPAMVLNDVFGPQLTEAQRDYYRATLDVLTYFKRCETEFARTGKVLA